LAERRNWKAEYFRVIRKYFCIFAPDKKRTHMKKVSYRVLPTILVCSAMVLTACSDEDNGVAVGLMARKSTSLFVATDRHEAGSGISTSPTPTPDT
jgi:hypothetical protein